MTMEAPTLIHSEPISADQLKAACDTPLAYLAVLHRYLDGGLTALSAPAQLVFLQLVRETLARGRRTVRITIRTLVERTGLAKDTVSAALRTLATPEIDLINIVSRGGPHAPACYEVRWYTCRKLDPASPPARARLRIAKRAGSIEHRLQELSDEDRAALEQCYRSLPPAERRDLEDRVMGQLRDLGIAVDRRLFHQLVLFETMRTCMYHHVRTRYPHVLSYHPVT